MNTTLQIVLLGMTLFLAGFGVAMPGVAIAMMVLTWVVAATTLGSGGAYVWRAMVVR